MKSILNWQFNLSWHDFTVNATDVDSSINAGLVMSINNVTPKCLVSAGSTVVRSLARNKMYSTYLTTT